MRKKARLCVDYSDPDSFKAIDTLRKAGFKVSAAPVSGLAEPELVIGSNVYCGIDEIEKYIESWKKSQEKKGG